jgi:DNA-binding transcriptional MerR regulator
MDQEFMITEEVAAMARTSPSTIRYYHHIGSGPKSFKVGRRRLYAKSDVIAWLEAAKSGDPVAS